FFNSIHFCSNSRGRKIWERPPFIKGATIKKDTLADQVVDPAKNIAPKPTPRPPAPESQASAGEFNLYKALSVVNRDTLYKTLGELQVIKISEELKIDCVWVKAAEYYSIWDSKNINPYGRDASIFRDTIDIELYNIPRGELWASPLDNTLQTSGFGFRWGRFHHGVDLNLSIGTPVFSVFDGIVRISAFQQGYGHFVVIRHRNGLETLYAHLSARKVDVGQVIKAGQIVGLGGNTGWSTGPHLHFEVRYEGNSFNPLLIYDFSKTEQLITNHFTLMPHHFSHLGNRVRQTITHKVVPGETLSIISAKYNVSVLTLARLNNLSVNTILKVGQSLIIK
ncbi:MAG: peptidoglycan DD-metalloendopeptidase family protein, partial [Bacteroidia bacterium]|nr:peptidoglycan DD-metalloendopeptidase family protein [Bacteroidia bacterium]